MLFLTIEEQTKDLHFVVDESTGKLGAQKRNKLSIDESENKYWLEESKIEMLQSILTI